MIDLWGTASARFQIGPLRSELLLGMDNTELPPHIVSLLNRIARAERFAAAMCSQEGRDRFLSIAAELQYELDLIQDQSAHDGSELDAETKTVTREVILKRIKEIDRKFQSTEPWLHPTLSKLSLEREVLVKQANEQSKLLGPNTRGVDRPPLVTPCVVPGAQDHRTGRRGQSALVP